MPFKKPALILSSANPLSASFTSNTLSQCQAQPGPPPLSRRHRVLKQNQRRSYASVQEDKNNDSDSVLHWPELGHPPRPPSPYQIFNQPRDKPYSKQSKRRFYELVKLYHPDRRTAENATFTRAVMLERYHLVVAAHAILSDPVKREAYDKWGHGWSHSFPDNDPRNPYRYGTQYRWRSDASGTYKWPVDQDPMYNATWEDWERWYEDQIARHRASTSSSSKAHWTSTYFSGSSQRQSPLYTNNYAFISIIFMLAALGGAGQATRANEQAKSHLERSQLVSEQTSKVLMEARANTRGRDEGRDTKDGRIRRFLRDTAGDPEGGFDARALRPGDEGLCAPGMTKDRDQRRFWEKPPENR